MSLPCKLQNLIIILVEGFFGKAVIIAISMKRSPVYRKSKKMRKHDFKDGEIFCQAEKVRERLMTDRLKIIVREILFSGRMIDGSISSSYFAALLVSIFGKADLNF